MIKDTEKMLRAVAFFTALRKDFLAKIEGLQVQVIAVDPADPSSVMLWGTMDLDTQCRMLPTLLRVHDQQHGVHEPPPAPTPPKPDRNMN